MVIVQVRAKHSAAAGISRGRLCVCQGRAQDSPLRVHFNGYAQREGAAPGRSFSLHKYTRKLVCHIWQQSHLTGALNRNHKSPLVLGAHPGRPARQNLTALRDIPAELRRVFIIDILTLIHAELAYLPALAAMRPVFSIICQNLNLQVLL